MPSLIELLSREIRRGSALDPADYSPVTSARRADSLSYAIAGCAYMLRRQKNTAIMAAATVAAIAAGFWLQITNVDWALLALAIALVWIAEFVNAAIEACVNLSTSLHHPMAKIAKDVAAGAVLIAAIVATLVGISVFAPLLIAKLAQPSVNNAHL